MVVNNELLDLDKLYKSDKFEFVVVYGRRRIGKTTLLSHFCNDKYAIFYVAEEHNDKLSLNNFSKIILNRFNMEGFITNFQDWEMAFKYIGKQAENKRLVLVIDEFPYITYGNKSILSILQNVIDNYLKDTKLFLIICGSSMSFMEKEVLSYKSPLFGRKTAQFKLEAFDFFTASSFFPNYSLEGKVLCYGLLGGIPQYLEKFNDKISVEENIKDSFLNKSSYFYDEPKNLLKQELREPLFYNTLIEVIAKGSTKLNEISTKVGESSDKCSKYINSLIELGILKKEVPIGDKASSRKTIYKMINPMSKFWYKFIFGNTELIEQRKIDYLYQNLISPYLSDFLGTTFEEISIQYMRKHNGTVSIPFTFHSIGRWWGNNPTLKREEEIDIIAQNDNSMIFAECKWRNQEISMFIVNALIEKSSLFHTENKHYMFFSKSGFKKDVIDYSRINSNVNLISIEDFS